MNNCDGEFQIERKLTIETMNSDAYTIKHKRTGMNIFYVKNDNKNKVFFTAFKTPPFDNSGAPHILEHSVLCGSKKYRAKDLFNELMKGSVNTFLNAMTFADKTVYPVASQNEEDFFNLVDVYLDSVFNPIFSETPGFFMQEGWHYSIGKKTAPVELHGIVYNEMKGAYDNPERLLIKRIDEDLYKNTPYEYDSGGVPTDIPSLTHGRLVEYYNIFYSPSNCLIYLYGDVDINRALDMIAEAVDGRILTHVPKIRYIPKYSRNRAAEPKKSFYSVNEDKDDGSYFAISLPACDYLDFYTSSTLEILNYILAGNDASPLRSAVSKSGICGDFSAYYRTNSRITSFSFVGKNCKDGAFDEYYRLVLSTLKNISEKPIEKELIDAALNKWQFVINEEDFGNRPKGLFYGISAASAWVYGGDLYNAFDIKKTFAKICSNKYNGLFEELLKKHILENENIFKTILSPEKGMRQKEESLLAQRLAEFKNNLPEEDLKELISKSRALDAFRKKPDSMRSINRIPSLRASDIPRDFQRLESVCDGGNVICTHDKTGIAYINIYFSLKSVPVELIPYCGLLKEILGKTGTASYSAEKIINGLNVLAGSVQYTADTLQKADSAYIPRFCLKIKTLAKNSASVMELISEVIAPKLTVSEVKRITDETLLKMESNFLKNGHSISLSRSLSYIYPGANFADLLSGIGFYKNIYGKSPEELLYKLKQVIDIVFRKENMFFGLSTDGNDTSMKPVKKFFEQLSAGHGKEMTVAVNHSKNEGFVFEGGVCFNSMAYDLYNAANRYSGKLKVAKSVLNLDYLWPEIRNKRGAYGCGSDIGRDGGVYFYSYRDPELTRTYETFQKSFDVLADYKSSERQFQKYIINAIKPFEKPLKPHEKLEMIVSNRLLGITDEMRQLERDEILSATIESINEIGETLKSLKGKGVVCSIGHKSKLEEENIFSSVTTLNNYKRMT